MVGHAKALTRIVAACLIASAAAWVAFRGVMPRESGAGLQGKPRVALASRPSQSGARKPNGRARAIAREALSAELRRASPVAPKGSAPDTAGAVGGSPGGIRIIDLHTDLAYALHAGRDSVGSPGSPLSPWRLRQGRVVTLVVSLFVGKAYEQPPESVRQAYAATLASLEHALESEAYREVFGPVGVLDPPSRVGVILSFEGADGFADRPMGIVPWIRRGACLVGLVHDHTNALAGSSTDPKAERRGVGLTERGRELARVAMRHGGVLDAAHASDATVDDLVWLAKASDAPVVVSHAGLRHLYAIDRNLDDSRLRAIASTGGVVGIDLHRGHLVSGSSRQATLDDVVAHLVHAVRVAGIEHVAIGSDFDGGIRPPRGVEGAEVWPLLRERLVAQGWTASEIAAVFHENAARVLAWAVAHGCGSSTREAAESSVGSPGRAPPLDRP